MNNSIVFGGSGAIGQAICQALIDQSPNNRIEMVVRPESEVPSFIQCHPQVQLHLCDYSEAELSSLAGLLATRSFDLVFVAIGILHKEGLRPEKSTRELSAENFQALFYTNSILPALIAKHFLPLLRTDATSRFAALSARVGSISDNRLGGWYAYRASKAALNMIIKTLAIETARKNKQALVIGLHPGTVQSHLSEPFQKNVPSKSLFSPEFSAAQLLQVLADRTPKDSGKCFAWDGKEIPA